MKLTHRRTWNIIGVAIAITILFIVSVVLKISLLPYQIYFGWALFALVIFLSSFSIRKKLGFLPIAPGFLWAQFHYYLGYTTFAVTMLHIQYGASRSILENALFILFHATLLGGILGLIINRLFAKRLAGLDQQIIYEEIPLLVNLLRSQAEQLVTEACANANSSTLGDFYISHLDSYFRRPAHFFRHLFGASRLVNRLIDLLHRQHRYLDGTEIKYAAQLEKLIEEKSQLDINYALQGVMKYWGIFHYPLAFGTIFLVLIHIIVIYAFRGV